MFRIFVMLKNVNATNTRSKNESLTYLDTSLYKLFLKTNLDR